MSSALRCRPGTPSGYRGGRECRRRIDILHPYSEISKTILDRRCKNGQKYKAYDDKENNRADKAWLGQLRSWSMVLSWQHKGFSDMSQDIAQLLFGPQAVAGQVWLLDTERTGYGGRGLIPYIHALKLYLMTRQISWGTKHSSTNYFLVSWSLLLASISAWDLGFRQFSSHHFFHSACLTFALSTSSSPEESSSGSAQNPKTIESQLFNSWDKLTIELRVRGSLGLHQQRQQHHEVSRFVYHLKTNDKAIWNIGQTLWIVSNVLVLSSFLRLRSLFLFDGIVRLMKRRKSRWAW